MYNVEEAGVRLSWRSERAGHSKTLSPTSSLTVSLVTHIAVYQGSAGTLEAGWLLSWVVISLTLGQDFCGAQSLVSKLTKKFVFVLPDSALCPVPE